MSPEDEKLFNQYQPLLKKIVFKFINKNQDKFSYYKNTDTNDWLNLFRKGICPNDLYQFSKTILINTIKEINQKNRKINNLIAYLYKVLYQEIKKYIIRQNTFIEFDEIKGYYENQYYISDIENYIYNKEIKKIIKEQIINPISADLNYKKEYILKYFYGFENSKIKTLKEIAKYFKISEFKTQSIHKEIIEDIKKNNKLIEKLRN